MCSDLSFEVLLLTCLSDMRATIVPANFFSNNIFSFSECGNCSSTATVLLQTNVVTVAVLPRCCHSGGLRRKTLVEQSYGTRGNFVSTVAEAFCYSAWYQQGSTVDSTRRATPLAFLWKSIVQLSFGVLWR